MVSTAVWSSYLYSNGPYICLLSGRIPYCKNDPTLIPSIVCVPSHLTRIPRIFSPKKWAQQCRKGFCRNCVSKIVLNCTRSLGRNGSSFCVVLSPAASCWRAVPQQITLAVQRDVYLETQLVPGTYYPPIVLVNIIVYMRNKYHTYIIAPRNAEQDHPHAG